MTTDVSPYNGWTVYSLKSYVDQRFLDSDKAVSAALQAAKEAVGKAEVAADKRFDALSEEADRRADELARKIGDIQNSLSGDRGIVRGSNAHRARLTQNIYALAAVGGFITAIVTLVATHH